MRNNFFSFLLALRPPSDPSALNLLLVPLFLEKRWTAFLDAVFTMLALYVMVHIANPSWRFYVPVTVLRLSQVILVHFNDCGLNFILLLRQQRRYPRYQKVKVFMAGKWQKSQVIEPAFISALLSPRSFIINYCFIFIVAGNTCSC